MNTEIERAKEVATLQATVQAQAREIRDLKSAVAASNASIDELAKQVAALTLSVQPMLQSAAKLDRLLTEADRQDGMKTLAGKIVGGSFLASIGAALIGVYHYFAGGG
jgi:uncharacterized coiled-coil protein SlyX